MGSIGAIQAQETQDSLSTEPAPQPQVTQPEPDPVVPPDDRPVIRVESSRGTWPTNEAPYDRYMRLGYAAVQREDHDTAVLYFRAALYERAQDKAATIAYWNSKDIINNDNSSPRTIEQESTYDRYMRIGYDATEDENYQTALINFRKALDQKPDDYYATQAIRNITTYIQRGEQRAVPAAEEPLDFYALEPPYNRYMRLGYAAAQRSENRQATRYFRLALAERPNDRYATIAYWNSKNAILDTEEITSSDPNTSRYDRYMEAGYDATANGRYNVALENFQQALQQKPNDFYATQAVRNVSTYIQLGSSR